MRELFRHSRERRSVTRAGVALRLALAFPLLIGASTLVASAQHLEGQIGAAMLNRAAQQLAEPLEDSQRATFQTALELSENVEAGDTIFVTDRSGVQTGGRVLRLSFEELVLQVRGLF